MYNKFLQSDAGQAEFRHLGLDIIHVAKSASPFALVIITVVHWQMQSSVLPSLHALGFRDKCTYVLVLSKCRWNIFRLK